MDLLEHGGGDDQQHSSGLATGVSAGTTTITAALSGIIRNHDAGSAGRAADNHDELSAQRQDKRGLLGDASRKRGNLAVYLVDSRIYFPPGSDPQPSTGAITGTPTRVGTFNFTAQVIDAESPQSHEVAHITIAAAAPSTVTIWPSSTVPGVVDSGPDSAVELGVKFRSDVAGTISGIRFYKASANTGTHVGSLWSSRARCSRRLISPERPPQAGSS